MKGFIASHFTVDEGEYTELQVLQTPAGYYLGTLFKHNVRSETPGLTEPGSRESQYFETEEEATRALKDNDWDQRSHP